MSTLASLLNSRKVYILLLLANACASLGIFIIYFNACIPDAYSYLRLAEGIAHGRYTQWYDFKDFIPDTFRNPGYPFFLFLLTRISESEAWIKGVQLILYFISVGLILRVADRYDNSIALKNIFLLLLLPSIYIPVYAALIFPEMLMVFLVSLVIYLDAYWNNSDWKKYLTLGLIYGFMFQVRPVFLFFPFIKFCIDWWIQKRSFLILKQSVMITVYVLTMMPFAFWNLRNHGVFKLTSLEGGAGVLHIGYWAFKMPGVIETRYWGNKMAEEMILFVKKEDIPKNVEQYNREWDRIDSVCNPLITHRDSVNLAWMKQDPNISGFATYPDSYTIERERLLKEFAVRDYLSDPWFTFRVKLYTAVRDWVTGIQMDDFRNADVTGKLKLLFPTIITGFTLLLAIIFIPMALIKRKVRLSSIAVMVAWLLYFSAIHLPFTIQARYTTPVRLVLLLLIALSLHQLFFKVKMILLPKNNSN